MEPHIYGVTEVNQLVKGLLDSAPALQGVAVRGELSNYKIYPSGHHYFTLKDQEGALRCVMFRGQASRLRFRPENGMKAVVMNLEEDNVGAVLLGPTDLVKEGDTVRRIFSARVKTEGEVKRERVADGIVASTSGDGTVKKQPRKVQKIGRNDPCPCGSGLKWKKCTCAKFHPEGLPTDANED